jgi:hypothetical protein
VKTHPYVPVATVGTTGVGRLLPVGGQTHAPSNSNAFVEGDEERDDGQTDWLKALFFYQYSRMLLNMYLVVVDLVPS